MIKIGFACLALIASSLPLLAQQPISAEDAQQHIGEKANVCGTVARIHWAKNTHGQPTFLDIDKSYPNEVFTIVIWGEDRVKFGNIEEKYAHEHVCASGEITSYRGKPEMALHVPAALAVR